MSAPNNRSINCPYCKRFTSFEVLSSGDSYGNGYKYTDDSQKLISCYVVRCNNPQCQKIFYAEANNVSDMYNNYAPGNFIRFFPNAIPNPADESIVESVKKDFDEANLSLSVNAINGAAMLARRALQTLCLDKGAKKGDELITQIDELFAKNLINEDLKDSAHQVRLTGNDAAHSDPVSRNDVEETLELLGDLCEMVYVIPARNAARKAAREKIKEEK